MGGRFPVGNAVQGANGTQRGRRHMPHPAHRVPDIYVSEDEAETILPIRVPDTHVSEDGLLGNYGLQRAWTSGRVGVQEPGPWGATALPVLMMLAGNEFHAVFFFASAHGYVSAYSNCA